MFQKILRVVLVILDTILFTMYFTRFATTGKISDLVVGIIWVFCTACWAFVIATDNE